MKISQLKTLIKKRAKPRHLEDNLQQWCVQFFHSQYPGKIIAAVPNGARTSMSVAVRLKRTGLLKGFPDLIIPHPVGPFHGLFVELKVKGNYPSPEQKQILSLLEKQCYKVAVIYTLEDFQALVKEYFDFEKRYGV